MILWNCEAVRDALPDALAGSLSPEAARAVAEHLAGCSECRGEAELIRLLRQHPVRAPEGLEARVRLAASAGRRRAWQRGLRPALLAAAAAGLLLGGGLLLRSGGKDTPRVSISPPPSRGSAPAPAGASPVDGRSLMQALPGTTEAGIYSASATLDDLSEEQLRTLLKELES